METVTNKLTLKILETLQLPGVDVYANNVQYKILSVFQTNIKGGIRTKLKRLCQ